LGKEQNETVDTLDQTSFECVIGKTRHDITTQVASKNSVLGVTKGDKVVIT